MSERITEQIDPAALLARVPVESRHLAPGATIRPAEANADLPDLPRLRTRSVDGIPDLEVGEPIGEGGMGVVLNAMQTPLMRRVAVKTVRKTTTKSVTGLLQEALITGLLEHPNVVPIHMLGTSETGEPLIVMKRVEGVDWWTILHRPELAPNGPADLDWHIEVLLQVCDALRFAHSRGIIHRDIKPENVMIGTFDEVYLLDWGVAISVAPGISPFFIRNRHEANGLAGTPAYMAPEQLSEDAMDVDVRTDVFLLGATLHHILAGSPPYQRETSIDAMTAAHMCEPQSYDRNVPRELAAIARKAMARSPEHRYPTVDAFKDALVAYRGQRDAFALVQEAERRLHRLQVVSTSEGAQAAREFTESFIETRFALRRAIAISPDYREARELLARIAKLAFEHYCERGELATAQGVLSDMRPEDAHRSATRLEQERGTLRERHRRLEELDFDRSDRVEVESRIRLGASVAVVWSLLAWYKAYTRWGVPLEEVDPNYLVSLFPTIGVPLLLTVAFYKLWISNSYNRRILYIFYGGLFAVTLLRIIGWRFSVAAHITTSMEFVFYTMAAYLFGIVADMRIAGASAILAFATVLAMLFPQYQYAFMGAAFLLFAPYIWWIWRPNQTSDSTGSGRSGASS